MGQTLYNCVSFLSAPLRMSVYLTTEPHTNAVSVDTLNMFNLVNPHRWHYS